MALRMEGIMHNISNCLGKIFYERQKAQLDQNKINRLLRQIEEIKLEIIDAAENDRDPPKFEDVLWLSRLQFCSDGYRFIWNEFEEWLCINGLTVDFREDDSSRMRVRHNQYRDFEQMNSIDTTSWLRVIKHG